MTRDEILAAYKVDANGIIRSPGKFEGEMLYVPYFWDMALQGFSNMEFDDEDNRTDAFTINADDRALFPELGDAARIELFESEQGFVYTQTFDANEVEAYFTRKYLTR